MGKWKRQAATRLAGEVGADSQLIYQLAEQIAPEITADGCSIQVGTADQDGQHFTVHRGRKALNSFCVWSSDELTDDDGGGTGRRKVYAEWDEAVLDGLLHAADPEEDSTLSYFGKLFLKNWRGVEGFSAYRAFLDEYRQALVTADPSATVAVVEQEA